MVGFRNIGMKSASKRSSPDNYRDEKRLPDCINQKGIMKIAIKSLIEKILF
jgi:hypothetical protein